MVHSSEIEIGVTYKGLGKGRRVRTDVDSLEERFAFQVSTMCDIFSPQSFMAFIIIFLRE